MSIETEIASLRAAIQELTAALLSSKQSPVNPAPVSAEVAPVEPPAAPAEEKPKRTRQKKEPEPAAEQPATIADTVDPQPEPTPAPAPAPVAEQAAEQPKSEPAATEVKLADLVARGAKLMEMGKTPQLKALVTSLGAAKLSALAPDLYPEALKRLDELLGGAK